MGEADPIYIVLRTARLLVAILLVGIFFNYINQRYIQRKNRGVTLATYFVASGLAIYGLGLLARSFAREPYLPYLDFIELNLGKIQFEKFLTFVRSPIVAEFTKLIFTILVAAGVFIFFRGEEDDQGKAGRQSEVRLNILASKSDAELPSILAQSIMQVFDFDYVVIWKYKNTRWDKKVVLSKRNDTKKLINTSAENVLDYFRNIPDIVGFEKVSTAPKKEKTDYRPALYAATFNSFKHRRFGQKISQVLVSFYELYNIQVLIEAGWITRRRRWIDNILELHLDEEDKQILQALIDDYNFAMQWHYELKTMSTILETITVSLDTLAPSSTARLILEAALELLGAKFGAIGFVENDGGLNYQISIGLGENWSLRLDDGEGVSSEVIRTKKPLIIPDIDKLHFHRKAWPNAKSEILIPLFDRGKVVGVLFAQSEKQEAFSLKDQDLLLVLGNHVMAAYSAAQRVVVERNYDLLSNLGLIARGLSHHILNELTPVPESLNEISNLIQSPWPLIQGKISDIKRSVIQSVDFVNEIQNYLGFDDKIEFEWISINVLVSSVVSNIKRLEHKAVKFNMTLGVNLPELHGNQQLLITLLSNLIWNAMDAVSGLDTGEISIKTLESANYIEILVSDNGPGISKHIVNDVFKPEFTTKNTGHGLGLWFSKWVAELHYGDLKLLENSSHGVTFSVTLAIGAPTRARGNI